MRGWIAFQLRYGTRLDLGVLASPHPAFGTPLPRAGEGDGDEGAMRCACYEGNGLRVDPSRHGSSALSRRNSDNRTKTLARL
jgi:hypothetical protein